MAKTYAGIGVVLLIVLSLGVIAVQTAKAPSQTPSPSPTPTSTPTTNTSPTLAVGESSTINGTIVTILGPVEDSRCPMDVQCVWAGTVSVRVALDAYSRDFTFTLGTSQVVGDKTITLISVAPLVKKSTETIAQSDYRLTFSVVPKN